VGWPLVPLSWPVPYPNKIVKIMAPSFDKLNLCDQHSFFQTKRVRLSSPSALKSIFKFKKAIDDEIKHFKPFAILNLLWMPDGIATWLSRTNNIPIFQIVHGVEVIESYKTFRKILRAMLSPLKKQIFRNAYEIFCVSHFTKELVKKYCHVPDNKIFVIHNGANPQTFFPKNKNTLLLDKHQLHNKFCFLTISRLEDYKGIDSAILAFTKLKDMNLPFKYLIGGTGPYLNTLKQMIKDYKLEESVEIIGKIPEELLIDYYNLANCFITLSREDYQTPNVEGFGLVFLEAALCKVPSLAGNSGGIPDAVIHQETGWLVNPTDIEEISATIKFILSHPQEASRLGNNAYMRVLSQLTWDHMAKKVITRLSHVRH